MTSQAYMLVYIRTSSLKANMQPIDPSTEVDPFIRLKVDRENLETRRMEYWQKNQLFYIVLPEMLRGRPMHGFLMDHIGRNDGNRVSRFITDPRLRQAMVFSRNMTIAEWLDQLAEQLGVAVNRMLICKYDMLKGLLSFILTKKMLKEMSNRKLSALFKPANGIADSPVFFVHVLDQSSDLMRQEEDRVITDNILAGQSSLMYTNCYRPISQPMAEESAACDDLQEQIRSGDMTVLFIKRFEKSVTFQESRLVAKRITITDLQAQFKGQKVFLENVDKGRPPEVCLLEDIEAETLMDCSKLAVVSLVVVPPSMEKALSTYYKHLSHKVFIKLMTENVSLGSTIELFDDRETVSNLIEHVHNQHLTSLDDRDRVYLRYYENQHNSKTVYNDESSESMQISELVGCVD